MPPLEVSAAGSLINHHPSVNGPVQKKDLTHLPTISRLTHESLGAEVLGLDLMNDGITQELVYHLRQGLLQYQVLVIRNQNDLTPERHIELSRSFGDLYSHPFIGEYGLPGYDEIVVISNERVNGKEIGLNGLDSNLSKDGRRHFWHSDLSYMAMPPLGSMLHAKKLPESGDGDTLFCDMYQAYETLDPVLQEEIEGLQAYHCFWRHARLDVLKQQMQLRKKVSGIMQAVPEVIHPVVRKHPETGRKSLFVNDGFTARIKGMEEEKSRALLDQLNTHATQPERVYRHRWSKGDLVFWDNRCTLHFATGSVEPRTLYRTTIKGDAPY